MLLSVFLIMFSNEIGADGKLLPEVLEVTKSIKQSSSSDLIKDGLEPFHDSFLSLLDEKNKTIVNLKKQLENQKMQLSYYLNERMPGSIIEKIAESCSQSLPDENMAVSLALNNFCKQFGIKSKLFLAYERMNLIDEKVSSILKEQDFVLRKIINKLWDFVRRHTRNQRHHFESQFIDFISDQGNVALFHDLLGSTKSFMRKMDCFKICCQRLVAVEEERNAIVEQVYSMPVEERMNCNYLLGIKMQNLQLENEMRRILQRQQSHKDRLKELSAIESVLSNLQREIKQSYNKDTENYINKMLEKLNEDANSLLEVTKRKRRKYEAELRNSESQHSEVLINRILSFIRLAVDNKDPNEKELNDGGIFSKGDFKLYEYVKLEVDKLRQNLIAEFEEKSQKRIKEYEGLKKKLNQVVYKTNKVKGAATKYKKELRDMKYQNASELIKLREERDLFKAQVEDLQAIREAYAQLVERQPNTIKMEREFLKQMDERDKRIYELEEENEIWSAEISSQRKKVNEQQGEINMLNRFIRLKKQSERSFPHEVSVQNFPSKEQTFVDSGIENSSPSTIYSDLGDLRLVTSNTKHSPRENLSQHIYNTIIEPLVEHIQCYDDELLRKKLNSITNKHRRLPVSDQLINVTPRRKNKHNDDNSKTFEKIFSKSFSSFSLTCVNNKLNEQMDNNSGKINNTNEKSNTREEINEFINWNKNEYGSLEDENIEFQDEVVLDENELLRDCSNETIPVACISKRSVGRSDKISDLVWLYYDKKGNRK